MQRPPILQEEDGSTPREDRHTCTANLYQCHAPALFTYIKHHIPVLNDAEDILTEVFISALRRDLSTMSPNEQRAWLWTVAHNKLSDHYRQARRWQQVSLETLEETLADGTTPEQMALQHEEAVYLRNYLQDLSVVQQEVLQLRFIGGLRCTEIAVLLNKREGAIRSILSRALNELRKYYKR